MIDLNEKPLCTIPRVISRFFKEMAEKHNVKVDDLNILAF